MWQRLPAFIREWSILIFGILLIVPFLYLSFHESSVIEINRERAFVKSE